MWRIRFSILLFFVLILSCRENIPETNNSNSETSSNELLPNSNSFDQNELELDETSKTFRDKSKNLDLNKFFSEFYYDFPKTNSYVDLLRKINQHPDIKNAVLEEDLSGLEAQVLNHPFLYTNSGSKVWLLAYGDYFWQEKENFSVFQIYFQAEPNLNNAKSFFALMRTFDVGQRIDYSGNRKIILYTCTICTAHNKRSQVFRNPFLAEVRILAHGVDDYEKFEHLDHEAYSIRIMVPFDHRPHDR